MATLKQLAASKNQLPNPDQEIVGITREMKELATGHGLLLIVSSSLSRSVESREGKKPLLSDLFGVGLEHCHLPV
jgi:replicative DNA helicase